MKRVPIKQVLQAGLVGSEILVKGWPRTIRKSKKVSFLALNDGSCQENLQVVVEESLPNFAAVSALLLGSAVGVRGHLVGSPGSGQQVELLAQEVEIIGTSSPAYPLQKKATSLEFLREQAHLRIRTNTFGAVFRVRHALAFATHQFFHQRGFFYLHSPIITGSDCEGAGEMFKVTSLDLAHPPRRPDNGQEIDWGSDYFGRPTNLTVSGQLEAECFAMGLGAVYTFGPTFRAENSNTPRHLAEFWMVEPEVAFADLEEVADLAADYIKYLLQYVLEHCPGELAFLAESFNPELITTLQNVANSSFQKITYTEAINILANSHQQFVFPVGWELGLQTEHEKYLTEVHFKAPVIVTDYPKAIKSFYMRENADGKTVRAMDVLVPGVGEIIGGSQREERLEVLQQRMADLGLSEKEYWWYLDLRRFGSVPHAGFGLGLERMVMYATGMSNIRDVIAFPRTPKNAEF